MKKLILLVLLLSAPVNAWAATVYVDPTCSNNGDGTAGTPCASSGGAVGPKNTWVGITWTAGNTYKGQGGTSETLSSYLIGGSGTAGNLITITSYGTGQFTFNATASYAMATISRSYILIDNVKFQSSNTSCLYFTNATHDVTVQNSTFSLCGNGPSATTGGVTLEGGAAAGDFDNIIIQNNNFDAVYGIAVWANEIVAANSNNWDNIQILNNTHNNGATVSSARSIWFSIADASTATVSRLTIRGNTISGTDNTAGVPNYRIQVTRNTHTGPTRQDRYLGLVISSNTISNSGGGIYVEHTGLYPGVQNCICQNTLTTIRSNAAIAPWWSAGLIIEGNTINGVTPVTAGIDGAGLDLENNIEASPNNLIVRSNSISNLAGSASVAYSGEGIINVNSTNTQIYGNVILNAKVGILSDGIAGGAGTNYISNNTIINSAVDGIWDQAFQNQGETYTNNIVYGSGRYGFNRTGVVTLATMNTNLIYGSGTNNYNNQSAHATDINTDPLLVSTTTPKTKGNSPARRAGTSGYPCIDIRGRPCWSPPDIGAYQATSGDPAKTRTPRQ